MAAAAEAEAAFNQHKRITWQRSLSCIAASDMGQEAPTAEAGEAENEKCLSKKRRRKPKLLHVPYNREKRVFSGSSLGLLWARGMISQFFFLSLLLQQLQHSTSLNI